MEPRSREHVSLDVGRIVNAIAIGCVASLALACSGSPSAEPSGPVDDSNRTNTESQDDNTGTAGESPVVTFKTAEGELAVAVELADDAEKRRQGLMFRETLEPDHGMLFVFPRSGIHPFWMKNTYISLDIIHIDSRLKVVGVIERATPLSLEQRTIDTPSRYVVEVIGGYAEDHGITVGTTVRLDGVSTDGS